MPHHPKQDSATAALGQAAQTIAKAAAPRRFEFAEGKSSKFWEITRAGCEVTVRFGRIGANGQTQTKTFADEAKAQAHVDKLIEEKTGKGYEEVAV